MRLRRSVVCAAAFALLLSSSGAPAQEPAAPFEPTVGQPGKDVVWVPSPESTVNRMLDVANVTADDFVIDLGSGDGRNIITAARRGARGLGVEFNPEMVELSRRNAAAAGVGDRVEFVEGDMFEADISRATVLALFLLPSNLQRLAPRFLELAPGTRIVVNTFGISGWTPDQTVSVGADCDAWCTVLLYTVPAPVGGVWRMDNGELSIEQEVQSFSGTLDAGGTRSAIDGGRVDGDRISFSAAGVSYAGRVQGDRIEGTVISSVGTRAWSASRSE